MIARRKRGFADAIMENLSLKVGDIKFRIQPRARAPSKQSAAVLPVVFFLLFVFFLIMTINIGCLFNCWCFFMFLSLLQAALSLRLTKFSLASTNEKFEEVFDLPKELAKNKSMIVVVVVVGYFLFYKNCIY